MCWARFVRGYELGRSISVPQGDSSGHLGLGGSAVTQKETIPSACHRLRARALSPKDRVTLSILWGEGSIRPGDVSRALSPGSGSHPLDATNCHQKHSANIGISIYVPSDTQESLYVHLSIYLSVRLSIHPSLPPSIH